MSSVVDALDQLAAQAATAIGVPATRDPSVVPGLTAAGGCVFVGMPTHINRLLGGPNLEVPVSLVVPGPSNLQRIDWLLDHLDALARFAGTRSIINSPIDIGTLTYPAVTATAQVAVTTT